MYEQPERSERPPVRNQSGRDAIDVNDFVYAATGARVRRLTMPDGSHWFPAVDVCRELGHTNPSEALRRHVPTAMRCVAGSLISREGLCVPARQGLRKSMVLLSLNGLIRLVNGCAKKECEPFKNWVTEVVVTVQREGSYVLEQAPGQPVEPGGPTAYVLPREVADAIVRLEEHNLRLDERLAESQQATAASMGRIAASISRVADSVERLAERLAPQESSPGSSPAESVPGQRPRVAAQSATTPESVLAAWRKRLAVTDDVWAVAVTIVPVLVERGRSERTVEAIAARTGLPAHRVNDCLRLLLKRRCIRQVDLAADGAPVYVLEHP